MITERYLLCQKAKLISELVTESNRETSLRVEANPTLLACFHNFDDPTAIFTSRFQEFYI
jgi:hypothetical protein